MIYEVRLLPIAAKELKKLPKNVQADIVKALLRLNDTPFPIGVKKLKGLPVKIQKQIGNKDAYRIRAGDYRILYSVFEAEILICVFKVAARKNVYRF
jgi:mRNA interferase RelE/StbE